MTINITQIKKGFSFIEIIIVIAVCIILVMITINSFSKFRDSKNLNGTVEELITLINKARSETLSSKNFSQHGIHFENNKATSFEGTFFSSSDPKNQEKKIPDLIEIFSISLNGGGNDVIFQKLTGETDQYGTISLRLKNDNSKIKIINIEATGSIKIND